MEMLDVYNTLSAGVEKVVDRHSNNPFMWVRLFIFMPFRLFTMKDLALFPPYLTKGESWIFKIRRFYL